MRQRLGQSSQDDVTLAFACQRVQLLDELSSGNIALLPLVAVPEQRIELFSIQVIDLLFFKCLFELLFVDDTLFKVV